MHAFDGCRKISRANDVVVGLLQTVMVQVLWGRAGLFRLPVIPSPSCGGHGAVR